MATMRSNIRSILETTNKSQTKAQLSFEQSSDLSSEGTISEVKIFFMDHKEGEGIFISLGQYSG